MSAITEWAYGRVNLIGEHTDYNGGWVLPTAIPQSTKVELRTREDNRVSAASAKYTSNYYELGQEKKAGTWLDYIQGATKLLVEAGHKIRGFDVRIESTIPAGSGLSSSAALEVALLKALRTAYSLKITDLEIAKMGQAIENKFVGANVGIMDQFSCTFAKFGEAIFLDAKTLEFERVQIPLDDADMVVINSGIAHRHSAGSYNQRRAECEEACRLLGIKQLRDVSVDDLPAIERLPEIPMRRARHIVTENARVHKAVAALTKNDFTELGRHFYDSHYSQRDDFAVSIPEIDLLVELCATYPETYGARLTGGGFGGSILAMTKKGEGPRIAADVVARYHKQTGETATILV